MGYLLKKNKKVSKINASKLRLTEWENILYRPISDFCWKDATKAEVSLEAINSYKIKFAI